MSRAQFALWWALFENASASVRSGDIFSAYVYLLTGSNSWVGPVACQHPVKVTPSSR